MNRVFIVSAARTAIGAYGGQFREVPPAELGAVAVRAALERAGTPLSVDEVISGNVLAAGHGMNISRQVALRSGMPVTTPAYTVNKVCGSGLKSVALAATEIACGQAHVIVAGGVESMSQAAFASMSMRWGARLGSSEMRDLMVHDGLTDVFHSVHMGITAENLAKRFGITREEQDQFALISQQRCAAAVSSAAFHSEIAPLSLQVRGKDPISIAADEHPRPQTTIDTLAKLKPAFQKDGTVTAGNASGINDGAAYVCLMSQSALEKSGQKPLAEVVAFASSGVEPEVMGIGPVEAVRKACARASLSLAEIELIEANEAFAVQALAVGRQLGWNSERVNVCGGAIALGHPIGASGARILVTLVHQMRRLGKRTGLATLCVGGGQGIALVVKRGNDCA